jgi:hypothetical protein
MEVAFTRLAINELVNSLPQLPLSANISKAFTLMCWRTIVGTGSLDQHSPRIAFDWPAAGD